MDFHYTLITGPRRSGKTTIANALRDRYVQSRRVVLIDECSGITPEAAISKIRGLDQAHIILVGDKVQLLTDIHAGFGVRWDNVFQIRTDRGFVAGA